MHSSFSTQILQTLMGFFESISISSPKPSQDGSFTLNFQHSGTLIFTPTQEGNSIVISLSNPPRDRQDATYLLFFGQAGINPTTGRMLHTGIDREANLVYSMVFSGEEFDLPSLENAMRTLFQAHS